MKQGFRQKIQEGKPLMGIIQTLPSAEVSEIIVLAGFQWLFIDMEHSALDLGVVQHLLQVCGNSCPGIVRVPENTEAWTKRVLDAGAAGIIFPQVNSAEEAKRIVSLCKYSPQGSRGVGMSRAQAYGMQFNEYVASANDNIAVILQIEHIEAVRNIDDIIQVPGIDALFIGPYDLSGSMGKIGQVKDPEVREKIELVRSTCQKKGMPLGIFTANPADAPTLIKQGYTLVALGVDSQALARAMQQALVSARS